MTSYILEIKVLILDIYSQLKISFIIINVIYEIFTINKSNLKCSD